MNAQPLPWPASRRAAPGRGLIGMPPDPNPASTAPRTGAPARHAASTAASTHAAWPFGLFAPSPTT